MARQRRGGSLENRIAFPLEGLRAVRAAPAADKPESVRLSATDWAEGGVGADDAVAMARLFVGAALHAPYEPTLRFEAVG